MLDFDCENCGAVFHSEPQHLGKQLRCSECGQIVAICDRRVNKVQIAATFVRPKKSIHQQAGRFQRCASNLMLARPRLGRKWTLLGVVASLIIAGVAIPFAYRNSEKASVHPLPSSQAPVSDSAEDLGFIADQPSDSTKGAERPIPSLANGQLLFSNHADTGLGELEIANGSDSEAVVDLMREGSIYRSVYLAPSGTVHMTRISPGDYSVLFATGRDWKGDHFSRDAEYFQFESTIQFKEVEADSETRFKKFELTLYPVPDGNARSISIDKSQFPRLGDVYQAP